MAEKPKIKMKENVVQPLVRDDGGFIFWSLALAFTWANSLVLEVSSLVSAASEFSSSWVRELGSRSSLFLRL